MSKRNKKRDGTLPKHQKRIVLCLAKHGVMTMSQTNKELHGENTSTTRAFHELERKEIVTTVGEEEYRGRKFSKRWLTNRGIAYALLNGANPETTRTNALKFSKDRITKDFFEFRSISPKIANLLDQTMLRAGKIDTLDLVIQSLFIGFSMEEAYLKKLVDIIKKSENYEDFLKSLRGVEQSIETLENMLAKSKQVENGRIGD